MTATGTVAHAGTVARDGIDAASQADIAAVEQVLSDALGLPDASLVIYRRGILVEFKTGQLAPGLQVAFEGGYRSWQVGPFEGHHCHLDLNAVRRVWFDAEPVSCQQGRLNYTVWFLGSGDCGNPYRSDGLFSVTLNAPYLADGTPRRGIIDAVYALHAAHRGCAGVSASAAFTSAAISTAAVPSR